MYISVRTQTAPVATVERIISTTSVCIEPSTNMENDHNETIEYIYQPHMTCPTCGKRPHPVEAVRDLSRELQDLFLLPSNSQVTCKYFISKCFECTSKLNPKYRHQHYCISVSGNVTFNQRNITVGCTL